MRRTLALVALILAACGGEDASEVPGGGGVPEASKWASIVVFEAADKIGGCAVGDLDPEAPGNEIAAVCKSGDVYLVRREGRDWRGAVIARFPGEMIQCAIGDADPSREGLELVVVGMAEGDEDAGGAGAAHVLFRDGDGWSHELVARDDALIHGVAIGDVDAAAGADVRHDGPEVVTVGFSMKARGFAPTGDGWSEVTGPFPLPSPGKTAVPYLDGVAVACSGGTVTWVGRTLRGVSGGEGSRDLVRSPAGYARIASDGRRLLAARDDGRLELIRPLMAKDGFEGRVIHRESDKLRGAVLADLDPYREGLEAATAGYGKTMTVLYPPAGGDPEGAAWTPISVFRDEAKLHHLAAGELLARGAGVEIVGCGYSGRLVLAYRVEE